MWGQCSTAMHTIFRITRSRVRSLPMRSQIVRYVRSFRELLAYRPNLRKANTAHVRLRQRDLLENDYHCKYLQVCHWRQGKPFGSTQHSTGPRSRKRLSRDRNLFLSTPTQCYPNTQSSKWRHATYAAWYCQIKVLASESYPEHQLKKKKKIQSWRNGRYMQTPKTVRDDKHANLRMVSVVKCRADAS